MNTMNRAGSMVAAMVMATLGVACASSSDDAAADSTDPAWAKTTSTLGVTRWGTSEDEGTVTMTGYDAAGAVRSQFVVERGQEADGTITVRVRSVVQGPAVLEYKALADQRLQILQDTFVDHADAKEALGLANENLAALDGALTTRSLHPLDNNPPLIGNQQQLICLDTKGNACTKPPDMGGIAGGVGTCIAGAAGLAGFACLAGGLETIGAACVIGAGGAAYGAYTCYDAVQQNANCKCVTACADHCKKKFNNYYMCPTGNNASCNASIAKDRADEATCRQGCGG